MSVEVHDHAGAEH